MTKSYSEPLFDEQWEKIVYFGVKPVKYKFTGYEGTINFVWVIREIDIEQLPFYDFWKETSRGSTCYPDEQNHGKTLIYLHDWERFCRIFIATGK